MSDKGDDYDSLIRASVADRLATMWAYRDLLDDPPDTIEELAQRENARGWRLEVRFGHEGPNACSLVRCSLDPQELVGAIGQARRIATHWWRPPTVTSSATLDTSAPLDRLATLTPEAIEEAVYAAMTEARAAGATWEQIGQAWGGRPRQRAQEWYSRRAAAAGGQQRGARSDP